MLNVQFTEEDLDQALALANNYSHARLQYVRAYLENGISLLPPGRLVYKFLAYTNSQFKDNEFWFITQDHDVEQLIYPLGKFENEP